MSAKEHAAGEKKARVILAKDPAQEAGNLKMIGGSASDDWNNILGNQTIQTLWVTHSDEETLDRQLSATTAALIGTAKRRDRGNDRCAATRGSQRSNGVLSPGDAERTDF